MTWLPHRTRVVLAIWFCLMLSAAVLAVFLAPGRQPDDGLPVRTGLPDSSVGYGMLAALLRAQGIPVTYAPIDGYDLHHRHGLVMLAPVSPRIWFPKPDVQVKANILYVPPKWRLRRDPRNTAWVRSPGALDDATVLRGFNTNLPPNLFSHTSEGAAIHWWIETSGGLVDIPDPGPVTHLRSFAEERMQGMLGVSNEHIVLLRSGPFLLLSDPDFLNNLGMADRRTAMMAVQLIDNLRSGGPVWIAPDYVMTASTGRARPLSMAFLPPFLSAIVCMIVVAILMAWQGLVRFGPLRSAPQPFRAGRAGLIESAAGLIERAGRTPRMSPAYATLMRDLALDNAGTGNDPDGLLRKMQAQHQTTSDFFRLRERAEKVVTRSELIDVARALWLWKQEMSRGRK